MKDAFGNEIILGNTYGDQVERDKLNTIHIDKPVEKMRC